MRLQASFVPCLATIALALSATCLALLGCGGSGANGAEQLAKQEELKAARQEAAQNARQSAKIAALERKLKSGKGHAMATPESRPAPIEESVQAEEPLAGLWKGEAVITYDSGEADPFNETIEINSLVPGQVAGYAEAHQGSTTCHGPLTYQGTSGSWYRFSAEERNVAECIDYSQVDLTPDGSGALSYRETTEVSVSTGRLERVR
jgi:hypothetical protein